MALCTRAGQKVKRRWSGGAPMYEGGSEVSGFGDGEYGT